MEERRACPSCGEELAHSAYYRHLNDKVGSICPGIKLVQVPPSLSFEDNEASCVDDLDSTFDLGSECEEAQQPVHDDNDYIFSSNDDASCDSDMNFSTDRDYTDSSDGEELWEISDSSSDELNEVSEDAKNVLFGVSLFLNFFHLWYHVSERAMANLLKFLGIILSYFAKLCNKSFLTKVSTSLPKSLYSIRKCLESNNHCTEYVVCPKCSTLYLLDDCIIIENGIQVSKPCDHIEFPNHPHASRRSKCNASLLKSVQVGKQSKLVPRKVYPYHSVIQSLKEMVKRPGFLSMCEHWREREATQSGVLGNIYDGEIWKSLQKVCGRPFLTVPNNLCFGLNIDWFNPYSETQYSVGVIYLSIFNLPRAKRYKMNNIILVGMMPGPNEPKDVNPFLQPLVEELNKLYVGIGVRNSSAYYYVRALLCCIMCDLPACRKVCGFSNFNAIKGCSKCLKDFPTAYFGAKPDYSGYDCDEWEKRELSFHRDKAYEHLSARTLTKRNEIQHAYGIKFSNLLNLPYFDIVRWHTIDPMHNLFLGIAKHAFKTWKELGVLHANDYETLQLKVDLMNPPPKLGRIVRKIGSGFASFTANEWKNWILIYSIHALHGVLPSAHFNCWCMFVEACRIFLLPVLTVTQIDTAHDLLVIYFKEFLKLYGPENCSPNMHMACHMKECVLDYGPVSTFWCFAFERFNGALEGIKKSWYLPEKQMLLKFLDMQYLNFVEASASDEQDESLLTLLCKDKVFHQQIQCAIDVSLQQDSIILKQLQNHTCLHDAKEKHYHCLASPIKEKCFSDVELSYLRRMYSFLYPNSNIEHIDRFYYQSKNMTINNEDFVSIGSRSTKSSSIAAHWPGVLNIDPYGEAPLRVGVVSFFFRHTLSITNPSTKKEVVTHVLAHVNWYMDHPRRNFLHPSVIISSAVFDCNSPACYIPVNRMAARCAVAKTTFNFDYGENSVVISVPLLKHI
jgi:hypothetical protein